MTLTRTILFLAGCLALTQGRFLSTSSASSDLLAEASWTSTFASTLTCGQCILGGYNFCIMDQEHDNVSSYAKTTYCCANDTCSYANLATWNCSSSYSDNFYSQYVCPFDYAQCGKYATYTLAAVGSTANVTISALAKGQTCFYTVTATCGGPAFMPSSSSSVIIQYAWFKQSEFNSAAAANGSGLASSNSYKDAGYPKVGLPSRSQQFFNSTNLWTSTSTSAIGTAGTYDNSTGGYLIWGSTTQESSSPLAVKYDSSDADCDNNMMLIAVTSTATTASLTLYVSSVDYSATAADDASSSGDNGNSSFGSTLQISSIFMGSLLALITYML